MLFHIVIMMKRKIFRNTTANKFLETVPDSRERLLRKRKVVRKGFDSYLRTCKVCGDIFRTTAKRCKKCDKCKGPSYFGRGTKKEFKVLNEVS